MTLDNGRVIFQGDNASFVSSGVMASLVQSSGDTEEKGSAQKTSKDVEAKEIDDAEVPIENLVPAVTTPSDDDDSSTAIISTASSVTQARKAPRKVVEDEKRAVGRIKRDVWEAYITSFGRPYYWVFFVLVLMLAAISPVAENW